MLYLADLAKDWEAHSSPILLPYLSLDKVSDTLKQLGVATDSSERLVSRSLYWHDVRQYELLSAVAPCIVSERRKLAGEGILDDLSLRQRFLTQVRAADLTQTSAEVLFKIINPAKFVGDFSEEQRDALRSYLMNTKDRVKIYPIITGDGKLFEDLPCVYAYLAVSFVLEKGLYATDEEFFASPQMGALLYYLREVYGRGPRSSLWSECWISTSLIKVITSVTSHKSGETCSEFVERYTKKANTPKVLADLTSMIKARGKDSGLVDGRYNRISIFEEALDAAGVL